MPEPIVINGFEGPATIQHFRDMEAPRYHAMPFVSQSGLREFKSATPHRYKERKKYRKKATDPMKRGSAIHANVLEPDLFEELYHFTSIRRNEREIAYKEFLLERDTTDEFVLRKEDEAFVRGYADGLRQDPNVNYLLSDGESEATFFWTDPRTGLPCKARLDKMNMAKGRALDLKSMEELTEFKIQRKLENECLPLQAVTYLEALSLYLGQGSIDWASPGNPTDLSFWFLFTPNTPPGDEAVLYDLDPETLRMAGLLRWDLMDAIAACYKNDHWPKASSRPRTASVHKRYLTYNPL